MPSSSDDREQLRQDHPGMAAHLPPGPPLGGAPEPSFTWPSWRVGGSQPHNIYMDGVHRLVVLGEPTDAAELAGDVVASLNADARRGVVAAAYGPVPMTEALLVIERIRELHVPQLEDGLFYGEDQGHDDCEVCQDVGHEQQCCRECTVSNDDSTVFIAWPCPTARAVGATS